MLVKSRLLEVRAISANANMENACAELQNNIMYGGQEPSMNGVVVRARKAT
jgi:hypothetical protein